MPENYLTGAVIMAEFFNAVIDVGGGSANVKEKNHTFETDEINAFCSWDSLIPLMEVKLSTKFESVTMHFNTNLGIGSGKLGLYLNDTEKNTMTPIDDGLFLSGERNGEYCFQDEPTGDVKLYPVYTGKENEPYVVYRRDSEQTVRELLSERKNKFYVKQLEKELSSEPSQQNFDAVVKPRMASIIENIIYRIAGIAGLQIQNYTIMVIIETIKAAVLFRLMRDNRFALPIFIPLLAHSVIRAMYNAVNDLKVNPAARRGIADDSSVSLPVQSDDITLLLTNLANLIASLAIFKEGFSRHRFCDAFHMDVLNMAARNIKEMRNDLNVLETMYNSKRCKKLFLGFKVCYAFPLSVESGSFRARYTEAE